MDHVSLNHGLLKQVHATEIEISMMLVIEVDTIN